MKKVKAFILIVFGTFALLGGIASYHQISVKEDMVEQRVGEEIHHEYKEHYIMQYAVSIGFMLVGAGLIIFGVTIKRAAERENSEKS